jgi:hypothetical protein
VLAALPHKEARPGPRRAPFKGTLLLSQRCLHFLPKALTYLSLCLPKGGTEGADESFSFKDSISSLPRLKRLRLVGGDNDSYIGLASESLEELDMEKCEKRLYLKSINCPQLKKLVYNGDAYGNGLKAKLIIPRGEDSEREYEYGGEKGEFSYAEVRELGCENGSEEDISLVDATLPATCIFHSE